MNRSLSFFVQPKMLILALLLGVFSPTGLAASIQDVEFPETHKIQGETLVLNGLGLRKVVRWGISVRVYVAGLYLKEKSSNPQEILKSDSPKYLRMVFLRGVDKEDLQKAWKEGIRSNCPEKECEEAKAKLKEFNKLMVDSKNKGTMEIQFFQDKVILDMDGRSKSQGTVESAVFSRNLLAVFIGEKPPTQDFKQGVLGLEEDKK